MTLQLTPPPPPPHAAQFYRPPVAYFEAVQLLRKGLLILAASVLSGAKLQAVACFGINAAFLLVLVRTKPYIYYPSSFFSGKNLFLLTDISSNGATLTGSILALVAALSASDAAATAVGVCFTAVNFTFAVALVYVQAITMLAARHTNSPFFQVRIPSRLAEDELLRPSSSLP